MSKGFDASGTAFAIAVALAVPIGLLLLLMIPLAVEQDSYGSKCAVLGGSPYQDYKECRSDKDMSIIIVH